MAQQNEAPRLRPAMLIINPVSGKKQILKHIPEIIRILMDGGYMVTTMISSRRGEATEFTRRYGRDFELICCAGGDGTLNEVLSGMAAEGMDVPLGYIPCGSTNDFAMAHGMATDILQAAKNIASGRQQRFDTGRFGERYFSYVAAFGAFSWLSYTTAQSRKNMLGHTAYILDGIKDLHKIRPERLSISARGVTYSDEYIFGAVCNTLSVAGTLELPKEVVDTADGLFEVLLIRKPDTIHDLEEIVHGLIRQDYSSPYIKFFQSDSIDIINSPGLEWALDGERSGYMERVHIEPMRQFLNLQG